MRRSVYRTVIILVDTPYQPKLLFSHQEGTGAFASGILKEKKESVGPRMSLVEEEAGIASYCKRDITGGASSSTSFSFASSFQDDHYPTENHDNNDDSNDEEEESDSFITNKMIRNVIHRERRRGSKTTDDIREVVTKGLCELRTPAEDGKAEVVADCGGGTRGSGPWFGSGSKSHGLARSKSVRIQRVKFGLIQDAEEGSYAKDDTSSHHSRSILVLEEGGGGKEMK